MRCARRIRPKLRPPGGKGAKFAIAYPRDASKAAAHAKRAKRAAAAVNDAAKELGFVPTGDAVALPALAAP